MKPVDVRFKLRTLLIAVAVLGLVTFIALWPVISRRHYLARRHDYIQKKLKQTFGERGIWILERPAGVEGYRVREAEPGEEPAGAPFEVWASRSLVVSGPKAVGDGVQAAKLARLFLEGERYLVMVGGDDPPGTVLQFRREGHTLVVTLAAHGEIDQVGADLVGPEGGVEHVSMATDCYDKPNPSVPSIISAIDRFLGGE